MRLVEDVAFIWSPNVPQKSKRCVPGTHKYVSL